MQLGEEHKPKEMTKRKKQGATGSEKEDYREENSGWGRKRPRSRKRESNGRLLVE